MPYTFLQTLGWLAHAPNQTWERMFTVKPHRHNARTTCRLRAVQGKTAQTGRSVVIFKRTGPARSMNWYGENPPCGVLGCGTCRKFVGMFRSLISLIDMSQLLACDGLER